MSMWPTARPRLSGRMDAGGSDSGTGCIGSLDMEPLLRFGSDNVRLTAVVVGGLCGMRADVPVRALLVQVRTVWRSVCISVAKASKVRILHLPHVKGQ